ncbi:MAG: hypothetical protein CSA58_08325 [Micrococcales bacterium]|nr:MAG: hypothetical protein CSA58_08325 [Micrococcales bacterium]
MVTAVRLHVEGVDLDDSLTNDLLGQHFSDYLWSSVDGIVTMTVYVAEGDVTSQVMNAAREVEHRLKGANVLRVHRDLVTQSDIASRVGVSREAVRKWTHRDGEQPFPAPFDTVGGGDARASKVWQWSDVVSWLDDAYCIDMDEAFPDAETVAHIDACLTGVRGYLDKEWQTATIDQTATTRVNTWRRRTTSMAFVCQSLMEGLSSPALLCSWTEGPGSSGTTPQEHAEQIGA